MDYLTTVIKTEVTSKIPGLKRFNELEEVHINLVGNKRIVVLYKDYHIADGGSEEFAPEIKDYQIIFNPNGLPLVAPQIDDPENPGSMIDDPDVILFDPATDEYMLWLNGQTGIDIAVSVINRLTSINGAPIV